MSSSPPPCNPFQRVQIRDGLLINAEIWQASHHYHRQRQNFHYQARFEPGIISGLGVAPISAPSEMQAAYRDGRWVQVKPGIAIDTAGNPIIVQEAQTFRIQSDPAPDSRDAARVVSQVIYLVINYVDPDDLRQDPKQALSTETFRIVEKTQLNEQDVELCRIELQNNVTQISTPRNVFAPVHNELNLLSRPQARMKSEGVVQIAQIHSGKPDEQQTYDGLQQLATALPVLYPMLSGSKVERLDRASFSPQHLAAKDLLYLSRSVLQQLDRPEVSALTTYLAEGGTMVITVHSQDDSHLLELVSIQQELRQAIATLTPQQKVSESGTYQSLQSELRAIEEGLDRQLSQIIQSVRPIAQQLNNPLHGMGQLYRQHPLRHVPFLFSQLPEVDGHILQLRHWDGMILMLGDLAAHCCIDDDFNRPRETLRTLQEFGVNLLHFAWRRRQMNQHLLPIPEQTVSSSITTLTEQVTQQEDLPHA